MRKLMWFVIGFAAGCVPGAYFLWNNWFVVVGVFSLFTAVFLCFLRARAAKIAATVLFGLTFSVAWMWGYDALYLSTARQYDAKTVSATVEITDYSYDTDYGIAADGRMELDGKLFRVRMYLEKTESLSPGDRIHGQFMLRLTTKGGHDEATYHQGKGIFLLAYSKGEIAADYNVQMPMKYYPAKLRREVIDVLNAVFPTDTVGFARALLLGDSTGLTYEENTAFKISGIRHVIAVSGLHVSILFALVYILSGRRRVMTALLGIPVLVLFAAVAGFTPSILRACIMQSLMILAILFKKEYDPPTALSFAVLVMLLINPLTITSVSFQLSVGCMIGIFLFCRRITDYLLRVMGSPKGMGRKARLMRWFAGSIAVTLSAMSVTTPLSAFYFGTVSIIGVLTNLVTLWVISFVFYGIMLACLLGTIWLPAGRFVARIVSWAGRYVLMVSKVFAALPLASVYTCSIYILLWLVFCYILLAVLFLSKNRRPAVFASCIVIGLLLSVATSYVEPWLDSMRITVMDVGQGQAILLQSSGKYYLVDCGGNDPERAADTVSQVLLSQGIFRLDGVIVTHYDTDHAGGVGHLLSRVKADTLYLPDIPDESKIRKSLETGFSENIRWVRDINTLSGGWGTLTMIPGKEVADENERSLCILFQAENCDILITGDRSSAGERALLEKVDLPELELLVVGHHGAKSSTCFELLSKTKPKAAVICVGADNPYGHPSDEVLERLETFGCQFWRTDLDGMIIFRR